MIEFISRNTKINFVSHFPITSIISVLLVTGAIILLFTRIEYGVDFRGGAEIQLKFDRAVSLGELRSTLKRGGFSGASVQTIGPEGDNEYLIKVLASKENLNQVAEKLSHAVQQEYQTQGARIRKVDIVGPKAGAQLRIAGFQAMGWALIAIMIYIGLRFDFKYSPGAIVALLHDVSIILGIFALTGTEFTLQTVAALLAVIGYSVNDTVIVYDRVREHEERYSGVELKTHINNAVNETLSRTILTSGTTLFISITMYFFGGLAIKDFFLAISLGVLVGTYSSIYVAANVTLLLDRFQQARVPKGQKV
ncbi:MAG: protein translocase subunit SecF [Bdellovibrionales bacterium]|jgi:preprotein translocase subunit SecF|nr:protein translocase subunit SecF [Bdellovibrionales bacterium]MBT3525793.1 protein translocase subunit SecF [Bdellovibrionales bacterium]MBT7669602.1 protein translocase subunit SecF [Bdellovibrionales bacterium]MBT7765835.1 protein translocase subunit SecF [Bdellovibrionales bacterium]